MKISFLVLCLCFVASVQTPLHLTLADEPADQPKHANQLDEGDNDVDEGAIFVPTPPDVVEKMLEVGKVTSKDLLYDLGCGDGRIVVAAAKQCGCHAVGYDISERKVRQSIENVKRHGLEKLVRIEQHDIFKLDLSKATVITLYLLPEMNDQLVPQLMRMKDGSRVLCHEFAIDQYKPDRVVSLKSTVDGTSHDIYLYSLPLISQITPSPVPSPQK